MGEPGRGVERELEEGVRRIVGALERGPGGRLVDSAQSVSRAAGSVAAAGERITEQSLTMAERRLVKRFRRDEEASLPRAFVLGMAAVGAAVVGITQPELFWFFFVALGLGLAAARTFARVRAQERVPAAEAQAERTESGRASSSVSDSLPGGVSPLPVPLLSPPLFGAGGARRAAHAQGGSRHVGPANRGRGNADPLFAREPQRRPRDAQRRDRRRRDGPGRGPRDRVGPAAATRLPRPPGRSPGRSAAGRDDMKGGRVPAPRGTGRFRTSHRLNRPMKDSLAARFRRCSFLLALVLVPAATLAAEPVSVPGGPESIRRLLGLDEHRPDGDFFLDFSRLLLSRADPRSSWRSSDRRRAVVFFAEDFAEWKSAHGCPALLSTRPGAWDGTRRALGWLGYRVRGDGPGFKAEPLPDAEAQRRQGFLDILGISSTEVIRRLAAGEDVPVSCADGKVELPFGLAAWRETLGVDEESLDQANAFLHFVKSVPASRMMVALHALDARSREELRSVAEPAGGYAGWRLLYGEALDGFALYPEALEIRDGRIRMPGGQTADVVWEAVVGAPPSDKARFLVKLFNAGGGKAAYVADALRPLPEAAARAFVLGRTSGGDESVKRFQRLYSNIDPGGRTFRSSSRDPYDLTHLAGFLTPSAGGEIVPPGGPGLWLEALATSRFPADEADLTRILADAAKREESPDDFLERFLRGSVAGSGGTIPAGKPLLVVSSLLGANPVLADPGSILLLFCGLERFHAYYAPLEDLPLDDPAIVRKYLFTLDRLDANGTDRNAEVRVGLFQTSVELLSALHRSGSLGDATTRELFRALLDLPLFATPKAQVSAGFVEFDRWLEAGLLGALREEEARFLRKMRTEALARDPEDEGPKPARTADDLVAAALAGWRAPAVISWRGGSYAYDPTADGASRRQAFAATQEHVSLAGLVDAAAERETVMRVARQGDVAGTRAAVTALLEGLAAIPPGREADERVRETAAGARYTLAPLQSASRDDVLSLVEAGIGRLDALRAERTLEALAVHVYSSSVLDPGDLTFTDSLLVKRHSLSWAGRTGVAAASPFEAVRIEMPGDGAPLRLAGSFAGLAEPLGLLHAEGLVYDAGSFISNDRVRAGLVVPAAIVTPARLEDDALVFVDLACRATEQLAAALAALPVAGRHEAWETVARDLVPASRRNRLVEERPEKLAEYLSPSDLFRIGRRLALRSGASLPRVQAALEAREAWSRLVSRFGEAGAAARIAELGPRPFHWAGRGRLADFDLPSYERLSEYRLPRLFADHLYDVKINVARTVVKAGDPPALFPLFLEAALDGLLRRAHMAFAFDWRALADGGRGLPPESRDEVLGAALEEGRITRSEVPGTW